MVIVATSGDTGSEGDSSGSEGESKADSSGASESSEKDGDSPGGDDTRGDEKDAGRSEGKSKSKDKTKTKSNERKSEKVKLEIAKAKQKIADRILSAMADTYNAINETTKIALISSLADTKNFQAYLDKQNALPQDWYTSEQVYQDMPQLLDPASVLYNMAQDKIMDEMIMMQYE